jgi:hypothetical protein
MPCLSSQGGCLLQDRLKTRKSCLYVQDALHQVHTLISLFKMFKQQRWGIPQKIGQNTMRIFNAIDL